MSMSDASERELQLRKQEWWRWHKANPHIWKWFERFAFEAIGARQKHYSAWAVVNRIRWHVDIETQGNAFKISNDWIAFYARLFHALHPEHDGFFRTKPLKEEREDAA